MFLSEPKTTFHFELLNYADNKAWLIDWSKNFCKRCQRCSFFVQLVVFFLIFFIASLWNCFRIQQPQNVIYTFFTRRSPVRLAVFSTIVVVVVGLLIFVSILPASFVYVEYYEVCIEKNNHLYFAELLKLKKLCSSLHHLLRVLLSIQNNKRIYSVSWS